MRSMFGGVAAAAAVRTFPFRVFSFPKEIVIARPPAIYTLVADVGHITLVPRYSVVHVPLDVGELAATFDVIGV